VYLKRNADKRLWVIFIYCLLAFSADLAFTYISFEPNETLKKQYRFYIFSVFTIIEFSLISTYLYLNFSYPIFKWLIIIVSPLFLGFALFSLLSAHDTTFDTLPASIESVLIIIFCVCIFYEQLRTVDVSFLASKNFWIFVALLIVFAATLFLFISTAFISIKDLWYYWPINFMANITKNILFAFAFSKSNKPSKIRIL
jgi:hypothetical protein